MKHSGEIVPCKSGLHASERLIDALQYAPGETLCRVRPGGKIVSHDNDKLVASERTILWRIDAADPLRVFARRCALSIIHLWDAPAVVREWLETGREDLRATARAAASWAAGATARDSAGDAPWDAAWATARVAARDAPWARWAAARDAAWATAGIAAGAAARVAARAATRHAAWVAARDAQNTVLMALVAAEIAKYDYEMEPA